ncbi:universal stress protein [Erythrobacter sp.]|jgi:nucleotide-binding universal stress UspA family protein|uniref:universal stress protein n=1 Tax=Erythrobacter sp. TaxID=1042 RepID=UPI002EC670F9|nr:universal stress protein [Erythrobacter sp.]
MSIKSIAVATDFSARADRAIDRAKILRDQFGAQLHLIHATNLADDDPPDMADMDRRMCAASGLSSDEKGVEFAFPSGSPPKAIAKACANCDADVLALGPARYNTIGDFFLGTAVDHILRNADLPVLVVKSRAHAPYDRIIAGTDYSDASAHAIIRAARMFPDAKVHIVHAWEVAFQAFNKDAHVAGQTQDDEQRQMKDFLAKLREKEPRLAEATFQLVRGNTISALREALQKDPNALVVLGSHGESGFKQATIGSVTSELLRYLEGDTLVINTKDAE